tara:strand:- start:4533 stop:4928 length:396 start_codon:yes stop_codon:yes gene_type:complete
MFTKIIAAVIGPITGGIAQHMKGKQQIEAAKVKARVDKIKRGDESDITLDQNARKHAGIMDDVSFFVFLLPALLAFYPPALPHITAGFAALKEMPEWWQFALGLMLVSVWGYRKLVAPVILSLAKMWLPKT